MLAAGSTTRSTNRGVATAMSTTYDASAPIATTPSRATSGNVSAKTPNGASTRIRRTSRNMASATPRKKRTTGSRYSEGVDNNAMPKATANTTSGNIAPSAAARTGFAGTKSTIHCKSVGARRAASAAEVPKADAARERSAVTATGSIERRANTGGATIAPTNPERQRNARAMRRARPPTRAILVASAPAIPTITSETTSGTTVMRIAFTKSVPNGSMMATTRSIVAEPARLSKRPNSNPATSASKTLVLSEGRDTRQNYLRHSIEQDKTKRASDARTPFLRAECASSTIRAGAARTAGTARTARTTRTTRATRAT